MSDLAYFYKIGFLTACADRGLDAAEAEALAGRLLQKKAGLGDYLPSFANPITLGALGLGLAGGAGAAAGYGIGSAVNPDPTVPATDYKIDSLKRLTEQAKRRKQQMIQTPGLFA